MTNMTWQREPAFMQYWRNYEYFMLKECLENIGYGLLHACISRILVYPRADGAKRRARVLIPPGYLHPGKRKH
jgi:hypothetical protein